MLPIAREVAHDVVLFFLNLERAVVLDLFRWNHLRIICHHLKMEKSFQWTSNLIVKWWKTLQLWKRFFINSIDFLKIQTVQLWQYVLCIPNTIENQFKRKIYFTSVQDSMIASLHEYHDSMITSRRFSSSTDGSSRTMTDENLSYEDLLKVCNPTDVNHFDFFHLFCLYRKLLHYAKKKSKTSKQSDYYKSKWYV